MSKWNDEGEHRIADIIFGSQPVDSVLYIGLYLTPVTEPAEDATLASLTEPVGNGYARIALNRSSWVITGSLAEYAQQTFTASGGDWGNVYGYFITDISSGVSGGILLAVENFSDAPYNITDGIPLKITPKITVA